MNNNIDLPTERMILARGGPRARGRVQGERFAAAIGAHFAALKSALASAGIADPEFYLGELRRDTRFEAALGEHMPHLLDELDGIAEASSVAREDVYAMQLMDEEWAYRVRVRHVRGVEKCSSFAVHDGAQSWIGQNMDLGAYTDGFQRVVRHVDDPDRPDALIVTTAGVVALLGVNGAGVGVCVNSLPQLPSAATGIPVAFMIRRLLEARSAAEAAAWCTSLPHATNQHYLIADAHEIVSLECSAAGVVRVEPPRRGRMLHTNHPLADATARYPDAETNSVARLRSLEVRLDDGPAQLERFVAALSAFDDPEHPVCRLRRDDGGIISFTTAAMISRISAAGPPIDSWISLGPPSERGFARTSLGGAPDEAANA